MWAYDSIDHKAVVRAMAARSVPEPILAAFGRGLRPPDPTFSWRIRAILPNIGLGQGCWLSPWPFGGSWKIVHSMREKEWNRHGLGFKLEEFPLRCAAWADDMRLFAASAQSLDWNEAQWKDDEGGTVQDAGR